MRVTRTTLAFCVVLGAVASAGDVEAATGRHEPAHAGKLVNHAAPQKARSVRHATLRGKHRYHTAAGSRPGRTVAAAAGGISCVPYARSVTGMEIRGNGGDWWANASRSYGRGQRPEPGSVMAFRATGGMTRGHVAVVSRVLNPREVLIDHANWGGPGIRKGTIMHNVSVIDVSDNNDWTAVRVQVGYDNNSFGRVYPTYGFIYNRPDMDTGTAYAAAPMRRSLQIEQLADAQPVSLQPQGDAPLRNATPHRHR